MGLKYGNRPDLPIQLQLSWGSDHEGERYANIQIEDRASRMVLLEFRLDGAQLAHFLSGSSTYVTAELIAHLDRVGKTMEHDSVTRPNGAYGNQMAADHHAQIWAAENGWEVWEARRNNQQAWVFSGRRWVDLDTKES